MKHGTGIAYLGLFLAGMSSVVVLAPAQTQDEALPGPYSPHLQTNPYQKLRDFEPAADEEYRLGKGDEITVDFAGRPDLLAKLVVGPDGRISLPLAGDLMLSGLTRAEAAGGPEAAVAVSAAASGGGKGHRQCAFDLLHQPCCAGGGDQIYGQQGAGAGCGGTSGSGDV